LNKVEVKVGKEANIEIDETPDSSDVFNLENMDERIGKREKVK
jgi:hypothetical protein